MSSSIIAAFDFDYTLTDRDSLLFFLFDVFGWFKTGVYLAALIPAFADFLIGGLSRQQIKEEILIRFFKGWLFTDLQVLGQHYADRKLDRYLKPEAIERLRWHQEQGHRCLLVSAALDCYLKPWAARHGVQEVLASRLELTSTGQVTGRLAGLNCWGVEKQRRLLEYLGPKENYELYVYGDSRGDQELLALADHPFYRKFN